MAHLLYKWINDDVVLSARVTNFAKDFSNGYLFADLLHVYNQINDFSKYVNKSASNAKITNFCRLEPVFRKLGLRFDSKIAFEIIKEYPRTAMNLVAKLKNVLDKISSKASAVIGKPKQDGVRRLTNMPLRLTRQTYDRAQHELFEKSIRMYIKGQNQVDMAKHLKKFTDFQQNLEETAYQEGIAALQAFFAEKDMIRQQRRQNLQREHEFLHDWQEKGIEEWAYNQQIQKEREDHTRRMKKRSKDAKRALEAKARLESNAEAIGGIEKFEQTLMGAELLKAKKAVEPEELSMSMKTRKPAPYSYEITSKMNQDEFFKATKRLTGNPKRWKLEYAKAINMVKETAERKNNLREQRERRRRKFLADSQLSRATRASNIEKKQLCNKLVGKTHMERELLDDLDKISLHTNIFLQNRENREKMYTERRQLDEEEAVVRDNEFYMVQRAAYEEEIMQQKGRVEKYDTARVLSKKRATINFCMDTVNKLIDLSLRTVDLRMVREYEGVALGMEQELNHVFTLNDSNMKADGCNVETNVPSVVVKQEMLSYVENELKFWGTSVNDSNRETASNDSTGNDITVSDEKKNDTVKEETESSDVNDEVKVEEAKPLTEPKMLTGKAVQTLRKIISDATPAPVLDLPPKMPLTACIIGGPFSGKSSQAKRLADKHCLSVIDVDRLIQEAISWSGMSPNAEVMSLEGTLEGSVDDRAYHDTVSTLGKSIKAALMNGEMVEDQIYIDLIVAKIRLVAAQAVTIANEAMQADAGLTREEFDNDEIAYRKAMLKLLFDTWDEDGSGTLDIGEMVHAVRSFGEGLSQEQLVAEALELIDQMDEDHDGQITFEEAGTYFISLFSVHTNQMFDDTLNTILATTRQKPYKGWVLDGFPRTLNQAKLLERALTGYDDTAAPETEAEIFSKTIAPGPPIPPKDPTHLFGKSGVDMVLNIDAPMDTLFRRALGRRVDPLDDTTEYHVEFNPPGSENPIKMRLQDTKDMDKWRGTLAPAYSAYQEQYPQLKKWFESFNVLRNIDPFLPKGGGQLGPDALFARLSEPMEEYLNEKIKNDMAKKGELTKELRKRHTNNLYNAICEIKRNGIAADSIFTNKDFLQIISTLQIEMTERYDAILKAQADNDDMKVDEVTNMNKDMPRLKPKVFGVLAMNYNNLLNDSKFLSDDSSATQFNEIKISEFTENIMILSGQNIIVASSYAHLLSCIKRVANALYSGKEYQVGMVYEEWSNGPTELDHVTCVCDSASLQTVLIKYNTNVKGLIEEREALIQQEKEALDDAEEGEEDQVEIAPKPTLPKLFNLGELEAVEEDPKAKKSKKGKTPEPSIESLPVSQNDFVSQMLNYINSPSSNEEEVEDAPVATDEVFDATLKQLRAVINEAVIVPARENAPEPPISEPPPPPSYVEVAPVDFNDNNNNIDAETAISLLKYWDTLVEAYAKPVMNSMTFLSKQRMEVLDYINQLRNDFQTYLSRADDKNIHIVNLQVSINDTVTEDLRYDDDVKSELHQRVRECVDKLFVIIEAKETEAKETLNSICTNKLLEEHVKSLVSEVTIMMQAETDKFYRNRRFLIDISTKLSNVPYTKYDVENEEEMALPTVPVLTTAFGGEVVGEVEDPKAKGKGKGKTPEPEEDMEAFEPYAMLDTSMALIQNFVLSCQEKELVRRKNVKKAHEESFLNQLAKYDEEIANSVGGDAKGGKKGKGGAGSTPPPEFKPDDEMIYEDDLSTALKYEETEFLRRINRLIDVCKREGASILKYGTTIYDSIGKMIDLRLRDECRSVYAFNNLCRETVESEKQFEHLFTMNNTSNTIIKRLVNPEDISKTYGIQTSPIQMYQSGANGYEFDVDTNQRYYPMPKTPASPTVEVYADDKFSVTQEKYLEKAFNDAYVATNGVGMQREEVVNLVLRLGNEGFLPLKWSVKSVLELNDYVEQYEDKETLTIRLDDMLDSLLLRPSRPNSSAM